MLQDFEGKVAVVTGAASGVGRALAERFVDEGMKVVLADVEGDALCETARALEARGAGVFAGGLSFEAPGSDWEWVLGVHTSGVLHGIQAFVPILIEQDEPFHVVHTVSMAGLTTLPFSGPYRMSKHAALCLGETLYQRLDDIRNRPNPTLGVVGAQN